MLSENLDALAEGLVRYADTGIVMKPKAVAHICGALRALAEDARALERQVVPAGARLGPRDLEERGGVAGPGDDAA